MSPNPHHPGNDTITYELTNDENGNGQPNYGDSIKAVLDTTTPTPWVRLLVLQNGNLVQEDWRNYTVSHPNDFTFGTGTWTGGAGDATLYLFATIPPGSHNKPLASVSFSVGA